MRIRMMFMAALAVASLAACHSKKTDTAGGGGTAAEGKLFDRLGGMDGITAVVKDFVEVQVSGDADLKPFFANADIPGLEKKLVDQICEASGGPCKYAGKDMKTAHAGMGISEANFNSLVGALVKSLDKFKVKEADKQTLLGVLGPMKGDIVTK